MHADRAWTPRAAVVEVFLCLLVAALVAYDLCRGGTPAPSSPSSPTASALSLAGSPPSGHPLQGRFLPTVDASITAANTLTVCGNTSAPVTPWLIGGGPGGAPQALLVLQGGSNANGTRCGPSPAILRPNGSSGLAAVSVLAGSWLSVQGVAPAAVASAGELSMAAGSVLEIVLSQSVIPDPYNLTTLPALRTTGSCPSLTGVFVRFPNCPNDPSLAMVGNYSCNAVLTPLTSSAGLPACILSASIVGALSTQAGQYITMTFSKDCGTYTQDMFLAAVETATGVPHLALLILNGGWKCGSLTASFTVRGGTQAAAMAALAVVYQSALNGTLHTALGVTSVTLGSPAITTTSSSTSYSYSYPYSTTTWFFPSSSSSNSALLALLVLLIIPIGAVAGALLCVCLRRRKGDSAPDVEECVVSAKPDPLAADAPAPRRYSIGGDSLRNPAPSFTALPVPTCTPTGSSITRT